MDPKNNNQIEGEQLEKNDLLSKRRAARIDMESEEARIRRETEEKIQKDKEEKIAAQKQSEENRIQTEEKERKEKEAKEQQEKEKNKSVATKITKEVEKIKSVGNQISPLRTFKIDMDDVVKEQNISLARIAMQEEARRIKMGEDIVTVKSKNKIYIGFSLLFIVSGIITGWYIYKNKTNTLENEPVVKTEILQPIIYAESRKEIEFQSLIKETFLTEIRKDIFESETEPGKIKNIALIKTNPDGIKTEATSSEIFNLISNTVPDELKRSLIEKTSIYSISPLTSATIGALVFETESYQKAFAGMLGWEKVTMVRDLYELLTGVTPGEDVLALNFIDIVLNNQDARILNDLNGQPKIVYGILNGKTIIIAGSIDGFNELVARFRNGGTN